MIFIVNEISNEKNNKYKILSLVILISMALFFLKEVELKTSQQSQIGKKNSLLIQTSSTLKLIQSSHFKSPINKALSISEKLPNTLNLTNKKATDQIFEVCANCSCLPYR